MAMNSPHSLEIEQSVLGCVFLNPSLNIILRERLVKEDFYDIKNQTIFQAFEKLSNNNIDIDYTTVIQELTSQDKLSLAGGFDYVLMLSDAVATTSNFDEYLDILLNYSLKRQMIDVGNEIINIGLNEKIDTKDYMDKAEALVLDVSRKRKTSEFIMLGELTDEVKMSAELNAQNKSGLTGLDTGYSEINALNSGLQKEQLIIIAARPSMGKSAFAINIALNVAKFNKNGKAGVALFSLEMSNQQLVQRLISCEAKINGMNLLTGNLTGENWALFDDTSALFKNLNIYFDDSAGVEVNDIRAKCRKLYQENKLDLVIIDYLQLISGDGKSSNRQEEVSKISRSLKQMAKELKVPVIALSQLSRDVEKSENKKPNMAHLRESGSIEQDADVVMFLYREEYYNRDSPRAGEADIIVAKNRSGRAGMEIPFFFESAFSCFKQKSTFEKEHNDDNDR